MNLRELIFSRDKNGQIWQSHSWAVEVEYDHFVILIRHRTLIDDIVHIADCGDTINISISNRLIAKVEIIKKDDFSYEYIEEMFAKAAYEKFGHLIPYRYSGGNVEGIYNGIKFSNNMFKGDVGIDIDTFAGRNIALSLKRGDLTFMLRAKHPNMTHEDVNGEPIKDVISEITECLEEKLEDIQELLDKYGFTEM